MAEDGQTRSLFKTNGSADNPAMSLRSLPPDDESLVQPGVSLRYYAEELEGELVVPKDPRLSGGYADIYQGQWRRPDGIEVEVAVKVFKPVWPKSISIDAASISGKVEKRLKRELFVWTRVKHRNIHPLLGFWSQPSPRLISGWCRHGNLADYLKNNPDTSRHGKIQLTIQAARGLAHLHSQSPPICHGDIKPENILVNDLCEAVLSDFGLGRVMMELSLSTGLTTSDGPKGTPNYWAPELIEEDIPRPTRESDVFAFGGLLLAVLSGKPPFAGLSAAKIMFLIMQGEHPKLNQHPPLTAQDRLWLLMVKCWAQKGELRPTMREVVNELGKEVGPPTRPPPVPPVPPVNLRPVQAIGAFLGTLAAYGTAKRYLEAPSASRVFSDVWEIVGGSSLPGPASSSVAPPANENGLSCWATLHNLLRQERVRFNLDCTEDPDNGDWLVALTFEDRLHGYDLGVFNGKGKKIMAAKNAVAKEALAAIDLLRSREGKPGYLDSTTTDASGNCIT